MRLLRFPLLFGSLALAGCSGKPTDATPVVVAVAAVTVNPGSASVVAGGTTPLAAATRDAGGATLTGRSVTWSSNDVAVATVADGVVTGVAPGTATITATSEGKSGTAQITVTPVPVASVAVTPPTATVTVAATTTLTAAAKDAAGATLAGRAIAWSSGDPAIATVANGVVTGVAPGSVTITATSEGRNGTAQLTVTPIPVATVTLAPGTASILVTATTTLTPTLKDADGAVLAGRAIAWSSSAPAVATVANGVVTGVGAGTATITATSEGKSGTAQITVQAGVAATSGKLSVSWGHGCALTNAGAAYCWGMNGSGQLGIGVGAQRILPVFVGGGHVFTQIAVGYLHTCALEANGSAWCWGWNGGGELGLGTAVTSVGMPTAVAGGHVFTRIFAGTFQTSCGLKADGSLWCWGLNNTGTLGDGTFTSRSLPTAVSGALAFTSVSMGDKSICALSGATTFCWGMSTGGGLGNATPGNVNAPTATAAGFAFTRLFDGEVSHCGQKSDATIWCWGINQNYGLGLGSGPLSTVQSTPSPLSGNLPDVIQVSLGDRHGCALTALGALWCWGQGGRVGDGTNVHRISPVPVVPDVVFAEVSAGFSSTCARTAAGAVWCWGDNENAQLGDGTQTSRPTPFQLAAPQFPAAPRAP